VVDRDGTVVVLSAMLRNSPSLSVVACGGHGELFDDRQSR
jgi:hypothetical protein